MLAPAVLALLFRDPTHWSSVVGLVPGGTSYFRVGGEVRGSGYWDSGSQTCCLPPESAWCAGVPGCRRRTPSKDRL
ncbi:hypothetical protein PF004_g4109 [Phytophthora fragariae]|uniref:Uncharacterized protein n=1 Tax=Phytophthora fragariae TaxID=53985 RepID=A0A6G0PJW1_9STRA|nr:hypothetical protein PF004_g4109 [Phytophthora fragariae]